MQIWKLSQGALKADETEDLRLRQCVAVHKDTGAKTHTKQGKDFSEAPIGTTFYLCNGNSTQLIGRFTTDVSLSSIREGEGWLERGYQLIKAAIHTNRFTANSEFWGPQGNSTFWLVPAEKLAEFESALLQPFFDLSLANLEVLISNLDSESAERTDVRGRRRGTVSLNRILFGPPGTGKTYRSVAEAVAIVEGGSPINLLRRENYSAAKRRFDKYRADGQIEFLTFHPSYSYQDFIEGIRPQTSPDGELTYAVEPGVLKRIADTARDNWDASRRVTGAAISDQERFERAFAQLLANIEESKPGETKVKLLRGYECPVYAGSNGQS